MNEDGVIDLLRAAGNGGGATDIGPAMRQGAKLRRRRRIGQAVGGGAGLAAVVALGVLVSGMGSGQTVVVSPAGDPKPAGGAAVPGPGTKDAQSKGEAFAGPDSAESRSNTDLILDRLGPGFRVGNTAQQEQGQVVLDENGPLAEQLPAGYTVAVRMTVFQDTDDGGSVSYAKQCAGWDEKDTRIGACTDKTLSGGRVVGVQDYRTILGERRGGAWDATFANYDRGDDWVRVEFYAFDQSDKKTSEANQQAAIAWLGKWTEKLAGLAADRDVSPKAAEQAPAPTRQEVYQRYLVEALGSSFSFRDEQVRLTERSAKYDELPFDTSQVTGELGFLSKSQFEAACNAKPGLEACETDTLADGRTVRWRAWADRDVDADIMRGEAAVYFPREDGSVVMALLMLTGGGAKAVERDEDRQASLAWFDSLRDELTTAATDKRVGADVFTTK